MSTHKQIDKICCVIIAAALVLTVIFMNSESLGVQKLETVMGYEDRLFDTSQVHTIDIIMDDWEGFLQSCTDEEYVVCSVVIDGEAYKDVAIRAKGNTSLSQVSSYGNDRYSFKIEFDHYDSTKTYHGLDKLCLNNIIQDNTYMKDYLCYQLMGMFGVSSPLCSFANISVNGETWGLYLAVEGVEESFLQRNYSSSFGELYKPDSMEMGGGRGNGKDFEMDEWNENNSLNSGSTESSEGASESENSGNVFEGEAPQFSGDNLTPGGDFSAPGMPGSSDVPAMPGGSDDSLISDFPGAPAENGSEENNQNFGGMPQNGEFLTDDQLPQDDENNQMPDNGDISQDGSQFGGRGDRQFGQGGFGGDFGGGTIPENGDASELPDNRQQNGAGGGMGESMGSSDVSLIYTDDDYDSYSNIFNNAKTDITDADKDRLIQALKNINENTDIENSVDVEEVIRYFVVHNFVLNFDSYTGSMIHNYYLYESEGKLSMIPWDYNLAFGGFQSSADAESLINYPIDDPVSGGTIESRPMLAWIFSSEEYTQLYHQYFSEFIADIFESGVFEEMMSSVKELISPYVEADPTKFCTYEEFLTGIDTLEEFCLLRAQSVSGQLNGTIGSTSEDQLDKENFIESGDIVISDMGSMNNTMGGMGGGNMPEDRFSKFDTGNTENENSADDFEDGNVSEQTDQSEGANMEATNGDLKIQIDAAISGESGDSADAGQEKEISQPSEGVTSQEGEMELPNGNDVPNGLDENTGEFPGGRGMMNGFQDNFNISDGSAEYGQNQIQSGDIVVAAVTLLVLAAGLIFAFLFRRRGR